MNNIIVSVFGTLEEDSAHRDGCILTEHFNSRLPAQARTVILHRSRRGFGFVLRGAKAASPLMETSMCSVYPGLQYLDDVDRGGVADMAGLKKGDFLVAVSCYHSV
jgi:hypothetical protein